MKLEVQKAIATAWDVLWANNLKQRKKESGGRFEAQTYYLCAADIERQVRAFAQDTAEGRPWDTTKPNPYFYGGPRISGDLPRMVRDWLFAQVAQGVLTYHNFGRGHISRARFRPVGQPMAPAEKETVAKHVKRRDPNYKPPRHYSRNGYGGNPLCTAARRSIFGKQSRAWTTKKQEDVTCKRCLKLLVEQPQTEAVE